MRGDNIYPRSGVSVTSRYLGFERFNNQRRKVTTERIRNSRRRSPLGRNRVNIVTRDGTGPCLLRRINIHRVKIM